MSERFRGMIGENRQVATKGRRKRKDIYPSTYKNDYWIDAFAPGYREYERTLAEDYESKGSQLKSGKWLVYVKRDNVDEVWQEIKEAVEDGALGIAAKVSTALPSPLSTKSNTHVICVYTDDWTDEEDVMRVREELRKLGIVSNIPYKADIDTLEGKYRVSGHTRISKYHC